MTDKPPMDTPVKMPVYRDDMDEEQREAFEEMVRAAREGDLVPLDELDDDSDDVE